MPTSLVDHTSERKDELWDGFGIFCVLKQYFTGTVCFPAGAEFGCGDEKEVGVEKENNLELKIGAEIVKDIGIDFTVGTKTTKSEKWTAKSEKCTWCKPEICFPNSRIEVWTCSTVLSLYYHDYEKTYFYPGPVSQNRSNCGADRDGHCNCTQEELAKFYAVTREHSRGESSRTAMPSMIITPGNFSREDQRTEWPRDASSDFSSLYEQDVIFGGEKYAIGVCEPGEPVNWLYPANAAEPYTLSLLSRGRADLRHGPSLFRGRFLPVLAVTQSAPPNVDAEVVAVVKRPSQSAQTFDAKPKITAGLFTFIWHEFDFDLPLQAGTHVSLLLKLLGPEKRLLTYLSRSYVVLASAPYSRPAPTSRQK